MEKDFYLNKSIYDFTEEEWEAVCDGCGKCCFKKIISGWLWNKKIFNTTVCCKNLNIETGKCSCYSTRFQSQKECIKLTPSKLKKINWLPQTCAYRLLKEGKPLPPNHPLISGIENSMYNSSNLKSKAVHEDKVYDLWEYITEEF